MPENSESKKRTDERQIVIFRLGNEEFGVDINEVREIIRMESITKIPNTNPYIKGVINLRGGIIVVIDLAKRLGFPAKEPDNNTRIIVINVENNTVGMIVDSASEVLRLPGEKIAPAPSVITQKIEANYIEGVGILGERLLIMLDLTKVMQAKEIEGLQNLEKSMNDLKAGNAGATSGPKETSQDPPKAEDGKDKDRGSEEAKKAPQAQAHSNLNKPQAAAKAQ